MPNRPVFVSSNAGKGREVSAILGFAVERVALDLPETQALDVATVARDKAIAAFQATGQAVFVEDTGLYLDALSGLPGALVRWFLATIGPVGICGLIPVDATRRATARTAVALCDGGSVEIFIGETCGSIVENPIGDGGFGWDAVFRPDGSTHTFAEMEQDERNRYSMRRLAVEQLRSRL